MPIPLPAGKKQDLTPIMTPITLEKPEKKEKIDNWAISGLLWDIKDLQWNSMSTRKPDDTPPAELEQTRLVVSLLQKGEKEPLLLKAGWKDQSTAAPAEKAGEQKAATAEKQPPDKKTSSATKEPEKAATAAQPSEEEGAVFTLDGDFVTRVRQDLKRITEEK